MQFTVLLDAATLAKAEDVLVPLGIDAATAIRMFLAKIATSKAFPFELASSLTADDKNSTPRTVENQTKDTDSKPHRTNTKITDKMRYEIWATFLATYGNSTTNWHKLAQDLSNTVGVNKGSASIYLHILRSLVNGVPDTRTMKIDDFEYYVNCIRNDIPSAYSNALRSLESSSEYWSKAPQAEPHKTLAVKVLNLVKSERQTYLTRSRTP